MVFSAPLRILLLCLLHFSTRAVDQDVNPEILQTIVNRFENALGSLGQYAVAFRVEQDICLKPSVFKKSNFPDQNLLDKVKKTIENKAVYQSDDLIAAMPDTDLKQHSEYRLQNYLKNIVKDADKCVVYFTVNSPCLSKCLSDEEENIKTSLKKLQKYVGIKALAFKRFFKWDKGEDKREFVINRLKKIAPNLPYYLCEKKNKLCELLPMPK